MLFNSYPFLLAFFPVVFFVFFLVGRFSHRTAALWLALASLFFYGYWSVAALPLLLVSVCANYWFAIQVTPTSNGQSYQSRWLIAALVFNLGLLAYFKYANFLIDNANLALHALSAPQLRALNVVLPIGISFFTFTQIAFLVDCREGKVRERNFAHYLLFVTYFPHLIAGPVLHHSQMMPQFRDSKPYRMHSSNILSGLFAVTIGLAKKVLLADEFSQYATPVFDAAGQGRSFGAIAAWTAALAYTLQIYFDFSGYTDMAVGLSRMLGIRLPVNFNSPYKSDSIIEFWRRWHMTLSQFLRDYLYIPLGGSRFGAARRYLNLMLTMLLGGLWHGASWTFVIWGGLHGTYLLVNHAWRSFAATLPQPRRLPGAVGRVAGYALTFIAVVVAWVFFRATTLDAAVRMLQAMTHFVPDRCGTNCFETVFRNIRVPPTSFGYLGAFFVCGFAIVWTLPTTQACSNRMLEVSGRPAWLASGALLFCVALLAFVNASHATSEFIYFNF